MAESVFVDTNPLIYLLDNVQPFVLPVKNFFLRYKNLNAEFYTSTVTDAEFFVKPIEENQLDKIDLYKNFLLNFGFLKCYINDAIAEQAAKIRAKYKGVRLGDALQLASSIECGCNYFLTNDSRLKQVVEVNVVYLGDL